MANTLELIIKAVDQASGVLTNIGNAADTAIQKSQTATEKAAGFIQNNAKTITTVGVTAAAAGAGLEALARDQQDLSASTRDLADDLGFTEDQMRDLVNATAGTTMSIADTIAVMDLGYRQGLRSAEQLQEYAAYWRSVSAATGESAPELAAAAASLNAVGISADNVSDSSGALGYIMENTTLSVSEFLGFVGKTAPTLNDMGLSIEDAAMMVGALEEKGIMGKKAVAALTEAFQTATPNTDDFKDAAHELGKENDTLASRNRDLALSTKSLEQDRKEAITNLDELTKKGKDENETQEEYELRLERARIKLAEINNKINDNTKEYNNNIAKINSNTENIKINTGKLDDNRTGQEKLFEALGITNQQFDNQKKAINESSTAIADGARFVEESRTMMQGLQSAVSEAAYAHGTLIENISGLAPVLMGAGGLLTVLPKAVEWIEKLGSSSSTAGGIIAGLSAPGGALTSVVTFLTGPWGLAIAGAITAAVLLYEAYKTNFMGIRDVVDGAKEWISDRFDAIKEAAEPLKEKLGEACSKIGDAFGRLYDKIDEVWQKITGGSTIIDTLAGFFDGLGKVIDTLAGILVDVFIFYIDKSVEAIEGFIDAIILVIDWFENLGENISTITGAIKQTISDAVGNWIERFNDFKSNIDTIFSTIGDVITDGISSAVSDGIKKFLDLKESAGDTFSEMQSSTSASLDNVKSIITSRIADAIETASNKLSEFKAFTSDVLSGVKDVFVDSFATIRDKIGDAITNIQDILPKLVDKAEEVATKIREKFFIAFDTVRDRISDAITNIQDLLPRLVDKVEEITTKIRDRFFSGWDAIADKVSAVIPSIGDTMSGLVTKAEDIVAKIHTRIFDGLDRIVSFFNETVDKIKSALAPIVTTIEGIITTIQDDFFKGLDFVVSLINDTVDKIRSALDPIITTIADLVGKIESAISTMADTIKARFDEVVNKVKEIVGPIIQTFSDLVDRIKAAFDTVAQKFNEVFKPVIEVFDSVRDAVQKVIQKIIDLVNHPAVQAIISVIGGPVSKLAEKFGIELTGSIDDSTDAVKDLGAAGAPSASLIGSAADKISGFLSGLLSPADNAKKGIENIGTAGDKMPGNISPGVEGTKSKINEIAATAKNVESTVNQTFAQIKTAAAQTAEYVAHSQSNANTSNYTGVVTDAQGNPVSVPAGYTSIGTANVDSYSKEVYTSGGKYYIKNASGGYQQVYDVGSVPGVLFSSTAQTAPGSAALVNVSGEVTNTNSSYTGGVYTGPSQSSGNASGATAGAFDPTNADMTPAFIAQAGTSSSAKYAAFYVDPTSESGYSSRTITDTSVLNYWKNVGVPVKDYVWYMNHYVPAYNSGQDLTGVIPGLLALARGGIVMTPGLAMVGEAGPEIVSLNRGATVIPLDKTNQAIDYNLLADKVATAVTRAIGSGVVRDLHLHGNFFGDEAAFRQLNRKLKSVNNMESVRTGV